MGKGSPYGAKDTDQKKISFEQLVLRIPHTTVQPLARLKTTAYI